MSKANTKNGAVQLNEWKQKALKDFRKQAEKSGLRYVNPHCVGMITYLVESDFPDKMVRSLIKMTLEAYTEIMDDESLPWEVD